ncbi:hypothetical protein SARAHDANIELLE_23 [Hafnia phage vB_HpaM_SarahDanielle]|uniref:Uncharacterized protein n=1 Tax=Hafnia phage vB_HpaM_SarahDanielle TaxID=2836113 RepID=A0AAE8BBU6_9CAUD|nr:hypothetical protein SARAHDANIELLE_23 [Hafnia phage vB_HpaM_SarahDanielle]
MKSLIKMLKSLFTPKRTQTHLQRMEEELAKTHAVFSVRKEEIHQDIEDFGKVITDLMNKRLNLMEEEVSIEDNLKAIEKILHPDTEEKEVLVEDSKDI